MGLDKQMKLEILQVVNQAAREAYLIYNEEWISAKELCKQFQMIPPSWLKTHKHLLPNSEGIRYIDEKTGKVRKTKTTFPKHKINQMILEGKLDFTQKCEYRPKK